ncbi:hypothetical protein BDP27DRAFT_1453656 [Rhodocollybia butyracea]|uniref:F-box domain-containing protein n=1 Tax=Rhodocollybia butyracea TaxID=206335 RepID=A0A9P5TY22_9AGAR|nr:hypothetical protein BDP27DRAFT_1453656 [Rhodocollybia butyracea]
MALPPELQLLVIDGLSDSAFNLKNCSFVCRFWRQYTITHLFASIEVSNPGVSQRDSAPTHPIRISFANWILFKNSKHLTETARRLRFVFEGKADEHLEPMPWPFSRLSALEINYCSPEFPNNYSLFPQESSETVAFTAVGVTLTNTLASFTEILPTQSKPRIRLSSLTYGFNSEEFHKALLVSPNAVFDLTGLERLTMYMRTLNPQVAKSCTTLILQKYGNNIRHLRLSFEPAPGFPRADDHLCIIPLVPHLESLAVHYYAHLMFHTSLCIYLETLSSTKASRKLKTFSLILSHRAISTTLPSPLDPVLVKLFEALPSIRSVEFLLTDSMHEEPDFPVLVQRVRDAFPATYQGKVQNVVVKHFTVSLFRGRFQSHTRLEHDAE